MPPFHASNVPWPAASLPIADGILVGLAIAGDVSAFRAPALRHGPAMMSAATRIAGTPIEADDAVQEAFVIAWKRLLQLREREHVRGWLIRIATHQALTHLRGHRREVPFPRFLQSPDENGPEASAMRNAKLTDLSVAVRALTNTQRDCWLLREVEQMRYTEIARTTGLTTGQVRGNIARARFHIQTSMEGWR